MTVKDKAIQAMLLGDWKNAASLNKTLIKEDPKDIDALNRLAYALTVLGKIPDANHQAAVAHRVTHKTNADPVSAGFRIALRALRPTRVNWGN